MKKPTNIVALVDAYKAQNNSVDNSYFKMFGCDLKEQEVETLSNMIKDLKCAGANSGDLSYFWIDYSIPQISKQFDLLRFGENYNLNIELKSSSNEEKICKQLKRNKTYLRILGRTSNHFTYVLNEKQFHYFNDGKLIKVKPDFVLDFMRSQKLEHVHDIDQLFDPSQYLVSPFNSDSKFIAENYFLTSQQEEFKNKILSSDGRRFKITGSPGTGKTLLTYDIAATLIALDSVVSVVHCGPNLNIGQKTLKCDHKWNIFVAKDYQDALNLNPDYIIIDEAQRFYKKQFDMIEEYLTNNNPGCKLILSYDKKQTLSVKEEGYNLAPEIEELENFEKYSLSEKIRTNKELSLFIQGLFDLNKLKNVKNFDNIALQYFSVNSDVEKIIPLLELEGWKYIKYTIPEYSGKDISEMSFNSDLNAHLVIGQEYDKVVVVIGRNFSYNSENKLTYSGDSSKHYSPLRMLYQMVTRTRKKIMLIIVDNEMFLEKIVGAIRLPKD